MFQIRSFCREYALFDSDFDSEKPEFIQKNQNLFRILSKKMTVKAPAHWTAHKQPQIICPPPGRRDGNAQLQVPGLAHPAAVVLFRSGSTCSYWSLSLLLQGSWSKLTQRNTFSWTCSSTNLRWRYSCGRNLFKSVKHYGVFVFGSLFVCLFVQSINRSFNIWKSVLFVCLCNLNIARMVGCNPSCWNRPSPTAEQNENILRKAWAISLVVSLIASFRLDQIDQND